MNDDHLLNYLKEPNLFYPLVNQDYRVYQKRKEYPLPSRQIESLEKIAMMQRYYQCNPVRFIKDFFNVELLDIQSLIIQKSWNCPNVLVTATRGLGKALNLNTNVPTPLGNKELSEIHVGDYVLSADGKPTKVTHESPIYLNHDCYEITFSDGEVIIADENHLWELRVNGIPYVCNTKDIYYSNLKFFTIDICEETNGKYERKQYKVLNDGSRYYKTIVNIERTESVPVKCLVVDNSDHLFLCGEHNTITHNSTIIDLEVMAKGMLFSNYWCFIASGSGSQAEQTFTTLERLANDEIDTFRNSTCKLFKDEIVINNAGGDGFSHSSNGFKYTLHNGAMTMTLNSNVDAKRGKTDYYVFVHSRNLII